MINKNYTIEEVAENIINNVIGEIILKVQDEGKIYINIKDLFIDNFDFISESDLTGATLKDVEYKVNLSEVISKLIFYGYDIIDVLSGDKLIDNSNLKYFIDRDIIIKLN